MLVGGVVRKRLRGIVPPPARLPRILRISRFFASSSRFFASSSATLVAARGAFAIASLLRRNLRERRPVRGPNSAERGAPTPRRPRFLIRPPRVSRAPRLCPWPTLRLVAPRRSSRLASAPFARAPRPRPRDLDSAGAAAANPPRTERNATGSRRRVVPSSRAPPRRRAPLRLGHRVAEDGVRRMGAPLARASRRP